MPPRLLLIPSTVAAIVLAALFVVVSVRGEDDAGYKGSSPPRAIALPSFGLRDHRGGRLTSADLRGKVALVTFLETRCREACPLIAHDVGRALDLLSTAERRSVVAVAISVHPRDDTAASVRDFLRRHRVEGKLRYLIGTERELRPVWKRFHVLPAVDTGDADIHSAPVRIFDREGRWVSTLHSGVDLTPENLAHDARAALDA